MTEQQQVYADWGMVGTVPEKHDGWEAVRQAILDGQDVRCERFRWLGDYIGGGEVIMDLSYLYVSIDGERYRIGGFPETQFFGRRRYFKRWLCGVLKKEGVFLRDAFTNLSIFI